MTIARVTFDAAFSRFGMLDRDVGVRHRARPYNLPAARAQASAREPPRAWWNWQTRQV